MSIQQYLSYFIAAEDSRPRLFFMPTCSVVKDQDQTRRIAKAGFLICLALITGSVLSLVR